MSLQNFTFDSIKKIRRAVGIQDPVISPLQEAPLTERGLKTIGDDLASFVKVTPGGEMYRRVKYGLEQRTPPPVHPKEYINALRVLGVGLNPALATFGVFAGSGAKVMENKMYGIPEDSGAVDSGIDFARDIVLLSPFLKKEFQPVVSGSNKMIKMNYLTTAARRVAEFLGKK